MTVQTFVTLAFILSFASQVIIAIQLCRWPLEFVLQYEWMLSAFNFMANAAACKYYIYFQMKCRDNITATYIKLLLTLLYNILRYF